MFSLVNLIIIIVIAALTLYWWHNHGFKARALSLALQHCRQLSLQLLDQSVVLRGLWPVLDAHRHWAMRRTYQFEFTSTGEQRYQGWLVILGNELWAIDFEPYKLPDSE